MKLKKLKILFRYILTFIKFFNSRIFVQYIFRVFSSKYCLQIFYLSAQTRGFCLNLHWKMLFGWLLAQYLTIFLFLISKKLWHHITLHCIYLLEFYSFLSLLFNILLFSCCQLFFLLNSSSTTLSPSLYICLNTSTPSSCPLLFPKLLIF